MIYFDNSATTFPKPVSVRKAVLNAVLYYGANPGRSGHDMSIKTAEQIYKTRSLLSELFSCDKDMIAFTLNCTHAINTGIYGVLQKGDHVIISDLEHNSVSRPIHNLYKKGIITYDVANVFNDNNKTIQSFKDKIKSNTKLIICTHGSNVFGLITPIREIGKLAKENNILFMVDSAQTAGTIPISMVKDNIDILCCAGHKGLYGLMGTGIIITNTNAGDIVSPLTQGGTGSYSLSLDMPEDMPDKLESGTVNVSGIISVGAGTDYILKKGIDNIYEHEMQVAQTIYDGLSKIKQVKLYGLNPNERKSLPVISFNIGNINSDEVASRLNNANICVRGGFHCAYLAHTKMETDKQGTVRASIGDFNTKSQGKILVNEIKKIANS